ncbi:MAG TPA: ATP-binding cassette domain-containing protein, partial [Elusimicrobiales bacterium]|nr:ATP-binding cassette domain-containing protein [Elusimicrobiales bacterium]
ACGLKFRNLSKEVIKKRVEKIIDTFSLGKIADKKVSNLSGGEKQKTAIARTLVLGSEVLLLDEPMTNLDKKSVTKLKDLLLSLNKENKKTIIFSTHIDSQAHELTKNIITINEGEIL